jgi:TDG/mug DNA glycosylase family protein
VAPSPDPHARTIRAYDHGARRWERTRSAEPDGLDELRAMLGADPGRIADLGCGPGWHLEGLGPGAIGLDASAAMLERARARGVRAPLLRADLRQLPLRTGALDAAWASRSHVHLARAEVPLALWDLHRSLRPGAPARLVLFGGDLEHGRIEGDELGDRWFSAWPEQLLRDVVAGAGFDLELLERRPDGEVDQLVVWVRRAGTLADTVSSGMRLLLVGLNPSRAAAAAGVGFHRPGNRAWPALLAAGLATRDRDPLHLLRTHRIGMTDLVKRPTDRAAELRPAEYRAGVDRLDRLCAWLHPRAVCVVGLTGWRHGVDPDAAAGVQAATLGGRPVYLMPNPSGANAHTTLDDLVEHLRAAARLADDC